MIDILPSLKCKKKFITIERCINVTDFIQNFIESNIKYQYYIKRRFVNKYYKCRYNRLLSEYEEEYGYFDLDKESKEEEPKTEKDYFKNLLLDVYSKIIYDMDDIDDDEYIDEFKPNKFESRLRDKIDIERKSDPKVNMYYCSDVVKQANIDIKSGLKRCYEDYLNDGKHHDLHYKYYNGRRGCFNIPSRNEIVKRGNLSGKVHFIDSNTIEFRASKNGIKNTFNIDVTEPIYDKSQGDTYYILNKNAKGIQYSFRHSDITDMYFKHDNGKYYIGLAIEVNYFLNTDSIKQRKECCGIDLGIHNPITFFDGSTIDKKTNNTIRFPKEVEAEIRKKEARIGRLQAVRENKRLTNLERMKMDPTVKEVSNNMIKIDNKISKLYKRIRNIKLNWRRNEAKKLATSYQHLVVDEFKQSNDHDDIPKKTINYINHENRFHCMYLFIECLKHACEKYDTYYIKAPKKTTRTCSICLHENDKLKREKRVFVCSECKVKMDRDLNAAMNCYRSFYEPDKYEFSDT